MTENQHIIDTLMIFYHNLNMINYKPDLKDYSYAFSHEDIAETCKILENSGYIIANYKSDESKTPIFMNAVISAKGVEFLKKIRKID